MSTPRQPSRLEIYSADGVFYPRELTELDGKLYLVNADGTTTILNKSEVTTIKDATGAVIGGVDSSTAGTVTIPNATTSKRGLMVFGTSTPKAAGTATVGTSDSAARVDHVHPVQTTISGNAGTATKLATAVNIGLSGVTATTQSFDGSKAITIPITAVPASIVTGLTTVATSGKYSDLSGTPVIPVATDEEVPLAPGTAAVGESDDFARADHVHPVQTTISGNAGTATKLAAGVNIGLSGVTATAQKFDGSKAITIPITAVPASIVTGLATVATSGSYNDLSNKPTIYGPATVTPKAAGTAAVGTGTTFARADHVHPVQTTVSGNAGTATKLATAVNIGLSGVTATSQSFDGSDDITIPITAVPASIVTGLATVATSGSYNDLSNKPTIYGPSSSAPKAPASSAAVGTGTTFARADHVHPIQTTVSGNAGTATKLATAVNIGLSGAVTATAQSFDGSKAITIPVASIDGSKITGTIPLSAIPKGAQERLIPVADDEARLALTSSDAQNGDVIKVEDTGIMYYITDDTRLGTDEAFSVFTAGAASSVAWTGITGKPNFATVATSGSYNDLSNKPTIYSASSTTPKVAGTAAVGSETKFARGDHVHPAQTSVSGNAGTATKLATAVNIGLSGVTATAQSFDGSKAITIPITAVPASIVTGLATVATSGKYSDLSGTPSIPAASSTTPKVAGTAAVGTGTTWARADHVHPAQTTVSGNAGTATKLKTSVSIGLSGVTATAQDFDGSDDITIPITAIPASIVTGLATVATSGSYNDLSNKPTIYGPSSSAPKAAGTAAAGTGTTFARADHVHPIQTTVSGNAGTATKFASAQSVALTGDVTGSASSQAGWSISTTLANSGVTAGSYGASTAASPGYGGSFNIPYVTVDAKGRVTDAKSVAITLPAAPTTISGNAGTATKLKTAVSIGLSGGAYSSGVIFNGSSNVSIPVSNVKESYLIWGGKEISGDVSPLDAAASNLHSANRFCFAKPEGITVEYSTDGTTFNEYTTTNYDKVNLVSGNGSTYMIGARNASNTINDKLRITLHATNMKVYTRLRKLLINITTNYAKGSNVIIEKAMKGSETTFTTIGTYSISGWSGWNSIPIGLNFGGGDTQTSNVAILRLTFGITELTADKNNALSVLDIVGIGDTYWTYPSTMAKTGHIYSYDFCQNVTFPSNVTATSFIGSFSGNATSATKFANAQSVALTGDVTGSASSQAGWSVATTLANSGVTAGSYGTSAAATLAYGGSFNVPYITFDAKGRATKASSINLTMPAAPTTVSGNAGTATKFASAQSVALTGDITGSASSQAGWSIATTLANSGVTAGSYGTSAAASPAHGGNFNIPYITVDTKGRITAASNIKITLPAAPTTISGNAGTATKLATARKLTIGATGKDFDGSAALSWTLDEIGAAAASHGTHVSFTTTTPKAAGTAAVGTATTVSRSDHVHPAQTTISGNAGTATKFASAQSVALTGDVTGSASSQAGWSVATTLANSGVTAGSYGPSANATPTFGETFKVPYVTVDAKGRVTAASTKTITVPAAPTSVSGNAGTATKFASAQSVALTGDITGSASSQAGWSIATTLANSGVTAGSYGPSANATPAHAGGTFSVPYITVDAKGRVTAASTKTITMPDGSNTYTATIGTSWSGSAAPYSQTITVSGIKATDNPIVDVVPSATYATAKTQLEEYAKIYRITTAANSITVYANEKTTSNVPIQLKCIYD